jgi:glycosyltransferase involved in cell wall biosynthesis
MCDGSSGQIGGVERQTSLMARWLAAKGYAVSMLTWDEGQPDDLVIDGVRIIKICRQKAGLPGVRFLHPKWTSLARAMLKADADIYYQNCGECVTGQVALWCRRHDRKFVYSVASDPDCDPRLPEMRTVRERVLYRYGLTHADRVVVQTRRQQAMLREGFDLDSQVIPMPCPGPVNGEYVARSLLQPNDRRILWIGRICEVKRPDRFLDLAELCPDLAFDLVGPWFDTAYSKAAYERAKSLANVTVHGPVPFGQVAEFYRRAACLCCTSNFEGFPNTFIEAWGHGVPVVSTFDPDNLIATRGLGSVAKDVSGLAQGIRELFGSAERWRAASEKARQYYLENHTVDAAMARFEQVFLDAVRSPASALVAERR